MHNGRPTKYTPKLGQLICNKIASGTQGLVKLCEEEGMPLHATILQWLCDADKKEFCLSYQRARQLQADLLNEEIIAIADEPPIEKDTPTDIARARLRIDARKWKAAKLAPPKQNDKAGDKKVGQEEKGNVVEWGNLKIAV